MGQSTDAILIYGIELPEGAFDGFDERAGDGEETRNPVGYAAWYGNSLDGCEIFTHCSYPMHILTVSDDAARFIAARGYPVPIVPAALIALERSEWGVAICNFCHKYNLPFKNPEWLLCSYWG